MRYLATTSDLQKVRGYSGKLTRKWAGENGKNRSAKVFVILEEEATGGFGEFSKAEALRNPGIASMIVLNNDDYISNPVSSEIPVLVRVRLDEAKALTEEQLSADVTYLVDLEHNLSGWDFLWAQMLSKKYGVRFINGILPAVDGLLIGMFDKGEIEKSSGEGFKGIAWDSFDDGEYVTLDSLDGLQEASVSAPKARKAPKVKPLQEMFDEEDELDGVKTKKPAAKKAPTRASRKASFFDSMF